MTKGSSAAHKKLKNDIRVELTQLDWCWLDANEQGLAYHLHGSRVSYGVGKGGGDILGMVTMDIVIDKLAGVPFNGKRLARWFEIECKTGKAVQTPKQKLRQECVARYGGYYCVVHSVGEAMVHAAACRNGEPCPLPK